MNGSAHRLRIELEESAMSDLSTQLSDRLVGTEESGLDPGLLIPLLRLLVEGDPVPVDRLAAAAGRTPDEARRDLAAVPDTEYDEDGRIVGQGLTLRPTPHRFTVDGEELYTWCALDTLIFPAVLDRAARVESTSPTSGRTVRVSIDPRAGVTAVEPATAVVSLVVPESGRSIRPGFCDQVHYFASAEDAAAWSADHPEAELLPVAEAHRLAAAIAVGFLGAAQHRTKPSSAARSGCC